MSDLLPCPFCGNTIIRDYHLHGGIAVHCVKCGASMTAHNPDAKKEAIAAWNRRAPLSPSPVDASTGGDPVVNAAEEALKRLKKAYDAGFMEPCDYVEEALRAIGGSNG